jgi:pilus assembly protein CpaB
MSRILLLLVALVAGGLAAFLATRGGGPVVVPETPTNPKVIEEARVQVLVASAPIGIGQRLSEKNMEWRDWPKGALLEDYIDSEKAPEALKDMAGTVARFEIFEGDPIRQQKLIRTSQGYLSAVLDTGMRGISIAVSASSASGGFIVPNDHVDVILTRSTDQGQQSETVVSNVRVLAINKRLGELGKTGEPKDPEDPRAEVFSDSAIATLELDPTQAEVLINADGLGKLSLALRSIIDFAKTTEDPVKRNAPIKLIRYGLEANVIAGTTPNPVDAGATVDPVTYTPDPAISLPMRGSADAAPAETE